MHAAKIVHHFILPTDVMTDSPVLTLYLHTPYFIHTIQLNRDSCLRHGLGISDSRLVYLDEWLDVG